MAKFNEKFCDFVSFLEDEYFSDFSELMKGFFDNVLIEIERDSIVDAD